LIAEKAKQSCAQILIKQIKIFEHGKTTIRFIYISKLSNNENLKEPKP